MTPFEIDILLWYRCRAEPWEGPSKGNKLHTETIEAFVDRGLLVRDMSECQMDYQPTDRLHAYIDAVERVPLPVQKWVMPE